MEAKTTVNLNSIRKVYFRPKEELGKVEIITKNKRFFFFKTKKIKTLYLFDDIKYSSIFDMRYEKQISFHGYQVLPKFDEQKSILYLPSTIIVEYSQGEREKVYYNDDKEALNVYNKLIKKLGDNIITF